MKLQVEIQGQTREVEIEPGEAAGQWTIRVDGEVVEADAHMVRPGVLSLLIGGQSHRVVLDPHAEEPALLLGAGADRVWRGRSAVAEGAAAARAAATDR